MQFYLLVNRNCNLSCPFCIRGSKKESELDLQQWQFVLERNSFEKHTLLLTGGEPSIYPQLGQLIDLSEPYFKKICIHTNGVDNKWVEHLESNKIMVQVSLDGTREMHNKMRASGVMDVFHLSMDTCRMLANRRIPYCISSTVNKQNIDSVITLADTLEKVPGLSYWKVAAQLPFGCGKTQDCLSVPEWNACVEKIVRIARIPVKIHKLFDFDSLNKYIDKYGGLPPKAMNCGNVSHKIYIYPDLTVYPCTCLTDFPLGNLGESDLEDILHNDASKRFLKYSVLKESFCYNCKYLLFCNGGCIGMSYHFSGKLGMGDKRCPLIHKM